MTISDFRPLDRHVTVARPGPATLAGGYAAVRAQTEALCAPLETEDYVVSSMPWAVVQERRWAAPLYWERTDDGWTEFTLAGTRPLDPVEPVCHVSYYEADAFARWAGARLPTEAEWEVAAASAPVDGPFVEAMRFHPAPAPARGGLTQLYGDAWQWTQSPYVGYPGYVPPAGAIGEYNGKWMADQWVLRGASCATPRTHARLTYRNFFPSDARWQFTSLRLASGAPGGTEARA